MGAYRPTRAYGQGASFAYTPEEDNSSPVGTTRSSGTTTPIRQGRPPVSPSNAQGRQCVPAAPASSSNPDSVKQRKRKGPKEKGKGGGSPGGGAVECPAAVDPVLKVEASHRTIVPCYTSGLSHLILYKRRLEI